MGGESDRLKPLCALLEPRGGGDLTGEAAPLLGGLGIEQPLQLGVVKYGGEFLTSQSTASGR